MKCPRKIFASLMAFVFGPLFAALPKVGIDYVEREEQKIRAKVKHNG